MAKKTTEPWWSKPSGFEVRSARSRKRIARLLRELRQSIDRAGYQDHAFPNDTEHSQPHTASPS